MWDIILILIISAICGAIAGAITGAKQSGCWANVGIGLIGSVVGFFLQRVLDLPSIMDLHIGRSRFPVIWTIIGSIVFIVISQLFMPKKK